VPVIPVQAPQPAPVAPATPVTGHLNPPIAAAPKSLATKAGLKWLLLAGGVATAGMVGWVILSEQNGAGAQPSSPAVPVHAEQVVQTSPRIENAAAEPAPPAQPVQTIAMMPPARQTRPQSNSAAVKPARTEEPRPPAPNVKAEPAPVKQTPPVVEKPAVPAIQPAAAEPPPAPKEIVRTAPRLLRQVQPNYTPEARQAGLEGVVGLSVQLNESGVPVKAAVTRPLDPGLDRKAIEAVAQWRFAPATADGKPVASTVNVEVRFQTVGSPGRGRPTLKK